MQSRQVIFHTQIWTKYHIFHFRILQNEAWEFGWWWLYTVPPISLTKHPKQRVLKQPSHTLLVWCMLSRELGWSEPGSADLSLDESWNYNCLQVSWKLTCLGWSQMINLALSCVVSKLSLVCPGKTEAEEKYLFSIQCWNWWQFEWLWLWWGQDEQDWENSK